MTFKADRAPFKLSCVACGYVASGVTRDGCADAMADHLERHRADTLRVPLRAFAPADEVCDTDRMTK